jgi:hypothetical protein
MEWLKIIAGCIAAAVLYGILHDQVTTRVCLEYFTVLHPPIFHTHSPTLLGLGWGAYATWPVGLALGILFAICARAGSRTKLMFSDLIPLLSRLLAVMALSALTLGALGYSWGPMPVRESYVVRMTPTVRAGIPAAAEHGFVADLWATFASYASGLSGGLVCCALVYRKRVRIDRHHVRREEPLKHFA